MADRFFELDFARLLELFLLRTWWLSGLAKFATPRRREVNPKKLPESNTSLATWSFFDLGDLRHMVIQELSKLSFWHQQRVGHAKQGLATQTLDTNRCLATLQSLGAHSCIIAELLLMQLLSV